MFIPFTGRKLITREDHYHLDLPGLLNLSVLFEQKGRLQGKILEKRSEYLFG